MERIRDPSKKLFFNQVKKLIKSRELLKAIEFTYIFAKQAHAEQKRDDGSPYFAHVLGVAWILMIEIELSPKDYQTAIIAALLHDMLEDTYINRPEQLHFIYDQISPDIATIVFELTKKRGKKGIRRLRKMLRSRKPLTKIVKAADRLYNLRTLSKCTDIKMAKKIRETETVILPWLNGMTKDPNNLYSQPINVLKRKIRRELRRNKKILSERKKQNRAK